MNMKDNICIYIYRDYVNDIRRVYFTVAMFEISIMSYCMQYYFTKFSTGELITQGIMHNNIRGREYCCNSVCDDSY